MAKTESAHVPGVLALGRGSLKYYSYFANGLRLRSKTHILEALRLRLAVTRRDKITDQCETFDYTTKRFQ